VFQSIEETFKSIIKIIFSRVGIRCKMLTAKRFVNNFYCICKTCKVLKTYMIISFILSDLLRVCRLGSRLYSKYLYACESLLPVF
jgi:hypothetical protein